MKGKMSVGHALGGRPTVTVHGVGLITGGFVVVVTRVVVVTCVVVVVVARIVVVTPCAVVVVPRVLEVAWFISAELAAEGNRTRPRPRAPTRERSLGAVMAETLASLD